MRRVLIIAEAGVNHNGELNIAKKMVDVAAEAGADIVKFQTFKADSLASKNAKKANYQLKTTNKSETQYEMLKRLELTMEMHKELVMYCKKRNITFLSTPFDIESADMLYQFNVPFFKIPSGEITNYPLLKRISSYHVPIILSTGMSTLLDIKKAMNVLTTYSSSQVTLLHCNTEYPTPMQDVNLRAMCTLKSLFPECQVGYSDHTLGIEVPIAAVALGATVIEKHFTLDRKMEGPDHKASLEPAELKEMVTAIRNIELALGNGEKHPSNSEKKNQSVARKSIVAACDIHKGDILSDSNLTTKRPGTGITPMRWNEIVGMKAIRDYKKDDMIEVQDES